MLLFCVCLSRKVVTLLRGVMGILQILPCCSILSTVCVGAGHCRALQTHKAQSQCSAVQCSAVHCSALQCSTLQCSILKMSRWQYPNNGLPPHSQHGRRHGILGKLREIFHSHISWAKSGKGVFFN